ncbi:response regulator [Roseospira marina]|uniref:Response regulator n=1 Tax=Roseospira marina TaxID=140057 RepID=A0A5M6I8B7_9PROT|nr:response regulator [Roseospira marina]KAA5603979.1 response regulator [Roseospira marina]MBB4315954.1 CheY-like chemotaxis protein [Roseospira marina]MBB5089085.1 CheY-like chemotaxis protein [Roseospira marina]
MATRPTRPPGAPAAHAPDGAVYRAALEATPQALILADADGVALHMNRRARRLLGVTDAARPGDWPGRLPGATARNAGGWDTLPMGDGGDPRPFWIWSRPLPPDIGPQDAGPSALLHALWPCRVNEDEAHAAGADEGGFDEMMAVLVRHALLGEMGGALAHQMTQPLNVIRLTAERAAMEAERGGPDGPGDQALADRFARLADQAEAVFETVALVQGAPAVAGTEDLQPLDLGVMMNRAAHLARGPLRAAGLRPEVVTPPDMPMALAEPILLLQVGFAALTVLADAIGTTAAEGATEARNAGRPRPYAAGAVTSLMVRLAPDAAETRLTVDMAHDTVFREAIPLTALAPDLSMPRRVMLAAMALAGLGGHLMMLVDDSGALRGVRLDLARAIDPVPDATAGPPRGDAAPGNGGTRAVRVLVAEDEIEAATEIAEFLRDQNYHVTVVGDVPTGITALDRSPFDVLITDLSMPGGGARSLMRAAEAAHPDLAIIVASGLDIQGDTSHAEVAAMADAILRKPFGLADLRAAVETVLGGTGGT